MDTSPTIAPALTDCDIVNNAWPFLGLSSDCCVNAPSPSSCIRSWDMICCDGNELDSRIVSFFIPESICGLQYLEFLDFTFTEMTGSIPSCLGYMENLKYLRGPLNAFEGEIPESICNLQQLEVFDFGYNHLTGVIPDCISNMTSLTNLQLQYNYLHGGLPISICDNINLQVLEVQNNRFNDWSMPSCIGGLKNLISLQLAGTKLYGDIPASICNLQQLQTFRIGFNPNLHWSLPPCFGTFTNLTELFVYQGGLYGEIPISFCNLQQLQIFDISYNYWVNGVIPECIGNMTKLTTLNLGKNQLTGTIPASIGSITTLTYIDFGSNFLSGPIPDSIGNLGSLRQLNLSNNSLTSIPSSLFRLPLTELNLRSNQLSGPLSPDFANLTKLEHLDLENNFFTGSVPDWFTQMEKIDGIFLGNNLLTGDIPSWGTFNFPNLAIISLGLNALTGQLPDTLKYLTALTKLLLNDTLISGQFPEVLSNASNINILSLHNTRISGPIPDWIGNMVNLQQFLCSFKTPKTSRQYKSERTNVSGELPKSLAKLPKISTLGLWNNYIRGAIPAEYGNISTLSRLYLESNLLTGNIPSSFSNQATLQFDVRDNCLSTPIPTQFSKHVGFGTMPQKVICEKFSSENPPSPTSTPDIPEAKKASLLAEPLLDPQPSSIGAVIVTITQVGTPTGTVAIDTPTSVANNSNSYSNKPSIMKQHRVKYLADKTARIEDNDTEPRVPELVQDESFLATSSEDVLTGSTYELSDQVYDLTNPSLSWLNELNPGIQHSLFAKQSTPELSSLPLSSFNESSMPTSKPATGTQGRTNEKIQGDLSAIELHPEIQRSLYTQSVQEAAPTSNTNLENHLQRVYGVYATWSHEVVMEWARLKKLDEAVVKIFRDYHIDGPLLATLTVHWLKEKCDVQDFRLRAQSEVPAVQADAPGCGNNVITTSVAHIKSLGVSVTEPSEPWDVVVNPKKVIFVAKATKKATHKAEKKAKKELKKAQKSHQTTQGQLNDKLIDNEQYEKDQTPPHTENTEKLEPANIEVHKAQDVETTSGSNHVDEATDRKNRHVNLAPMGLPPGVGAVCGDAPVIDAPVTDAPVVDVPARDGPVPDDAIVANALMVDVAVPIRDGRVPEAATIFVEAHENTVIVPTGNALAVNPLPITELPKPLVAKKKMDNLKRSTSSTTTLMNIDLHGARTEIQPPATAETASDKKAAESIPSPQIIKESTGNGTQSHDVANEGQHKKKKRWTKTPRIKPDAAPRVVKFIRRDDVLSDHQYQLMIRLQEVGTDGNMMLYSLYYHPSNPTTVFKLME
ncbi:hypothetical protein HDU76_008780 [Blyttiomyces sp. JEL0837]|nr:hypothetical protein HDU76_008780 [Blyttiomyces sp. JEL0837]